MVDMEAELAFLKSLQTDLTGGYSNGEQGQQHLPADDEDEEEDYDPSNLMPETDYPSRPLQAGSERSSASESAPQSPSKAATQSNQKPAEAPVSAKQPRTMGGFVVESEDDEDELPTVRPKAVGSALLNVARGSSDTPQRSLSQTPNNTLPSTNVPLHSAAQDQGVSGVVPTGVTDTVPNVAAVIPNQGASAHEALKPSQAPILSQTANTVASTAATSLLKARLPHDRVGILEDRIAEDPRGDMDAWLSLISEHRKRNKFDEARAVYDRFFKVFPSAAEEWVNYATMELQNDDFYRVEQIFTKSLQSIPNVQLWSIYLDYVRRRNNLTTDPSGNARQIVTQAYEFVLQNIGIDKDSGQIWQDFIQFIRSGPGNIGGSGWQDQQKMDSLRKAYQRAICIPTQAVQALWKQYDSFEMGLNKTTGRKFLQEKSPAYMTARSSSIALENITRDLVRTTRPRLPPALGFEGDAEYVKQVEIWKRWINWEKEDPLVLKDEDPAAYKARVVYTYKQALMALRFWPEMWYEAAEFCFQNDMESEGNEFLIQGVNANPESCLLAFKRADRIELTAEPEEGEEGLKRRGDAVREPYNKVLDALYDLINQTKKREEQTIARVKEMFAQQAPSSPEDSNDDDDDEDSGNRAVNPREAALQAQIQAIEAGNNAQIHLLKRTISYAWIALMRAMRRIQGKGKPNGAVGGFRQIFADARRKGRILSEVYVTSALIEYHCYKDPAATKIFERGMKLFPDDENFALEYLKHLIAINDITNARAVFETTVNKLTQKPETIPRAKPIFSFFHEYESQYGELSQITKLEKRMSDLFPEDPQLVRFSHRYSAPGFDPTAIRPIISPATQSKPKALPSIEQPPPQPPSVQNSPRPAPAIVQISNSPKRPFIPDESDSEATQPRKIPRGESPLKGAAGRRLDAARRNQARASEGLSSTLNMPQAAPPPSLPRDILFLLSIIPGAHTYKETRFNAERMVELLRNTDLNRPGGNQTRQTPMPPQVGGYGQVGGEYQPSGFLKSAVAEIHRSLQS